MKRETLRSIFYNILTRLATVEFVNTKYLPAEGGLLVTTNHMSWMDTLHLFLNTGRKDITALVADKYKKFPVFNWVLNTANVIWLDRDKADFTAFRMAADVLKSGVALGIAPEGTRSKTAQLQKGKAGAVLLAEKSGVPIVPVGITGTEHYFKELVTLRRPQIRLRFGPAYTLPRIDRSNRDESLEQLADEIMCRIAVLLPPKYWGYYQDHPRLQEMLACKEKYT